jgi:hypothetical protein
MSVAVASAAVSVSAGVGAPTNVQVQLPSGETIDDLAATCTCRAPLAILSQSICRSGQGPGPVWNCVELSRQRTRMDVSTDRKQKTNLAKLWVNFQRLDENKPS